jgi:hypothetical protein
MIMIVGYLNIFINLYELYLDYLTIFIIINQVNLLDIFRIIIKYNKREIMDKFIYY